MQSNRLDWEMWGDDRLPVMAKILGATWSHVFSLPGKPTLARVVRQGDVPTSVEMNE
jgi:hypothetical protein